MQVRDQSYVVPVFRALWIPPHTDHETVILGNTEFYVVYLHHTTGVLPPDRCCVVQLTRLMCDLVQELGSIDPGCGRRHRLVMELLLEEARLSIQSAHVVPLPSDRRLLALCRVLMDDPAYRKGLGSLSPAVGASQRTLARLFRQEMGSSFSEWRRQLRLATAIGLIAQGVPMNLIARRTGYRSAGAFSTMFRTALGVAPSRFCQRNNASRQRP